MTASPKEPMARRRGRPVEDLGKEQTILDVAEIVFAERGFAGSALRDIAAASHVNQALIRYYFGNKQSLFETVFKRRGMQIAGQRHVLLDQLEQRGEPATVHEIVRAYLTPQWEMKESGPGGEAFVKLQARLHMEPDEHAFQLRREVYDSSIKRYIKALQHALPAVPVEDITWRMTFGVGAYLYMLSGVSRIDDMMTGAPGNSDDTAIIERLVDFIAAGIMSRPGERSA